jgi:hypothetical protein
MAAVAPARIFSDRGTTWPSAQPYLETKGGTMRSRKPLLIAIVACTAVLAGCATGPYYDDDPYYYGRTTYSGYPEYRYYDYGPGYYVGRPSVSLGLGYSSRRYYRR